MEHKRTKTTIKATITVDGNNNRAITMADGNNNRAITGVKVNRIPTKDGGKATQTIKDTDMVKETITTIIMVGD